MPVLRFLGLKCKQCGARLCYLGYELSKDVKLEFYCPECGWKEYQTISIKEMCDIASSEIWRTVGPCIPRSEFNPKRLDEAIKELRQFVKSILTRDRRRGIL